MVVIRIENLHAMRNVNYVDDEFVAIKFGS